MQPGKIVVAVDGSDSALAAIAWAAADAVRRGSQLHIVHVYDGRLPNATSPDSAYAKDIRARAETLVETAILDARLFAPTVEVCGDALVGAVVPTVIRVAQRAELTVLGGHGRGGLVNFLGSVGRQLATQVDRSVVVVRGRCAGDASPVVVGADGSAAARHAVGVAFEEAAMRRTGVVAVRAYRTTRPPWRVPITPAVEDWDARQREADALDDDIRPWAEKFPEVAVERIVVDRPIGDALVDFSANAQLVVIGSRRRGGIVGVIRGSVSRQLMRHAQCPILLARGVSAVSTPLPPPRSIAAPAAFGASHRPTRTSMLRPR
jgi:nucleotide-binding universal stress UspA family protein